MRGWMYVEKVKLPAHVAKALEAKNNHYRHEGIAYLMWECSSSDSVLSNWIDSEDNNIIKLSQAIVNGYEVEETPEEAATQWLIKRNYLRPGISEHDVVMAIQSILGKGVYP